MERGHGKMNDTQYKAGGYVGKTAAGDSVYVEIKIAPHTGEVEFDSIEHEPVTEWARVSISGHYFTKGSRRKDWDSGGQILETLRAVSTPAMGFSKSNLIRLAELWERWHLNDMRAGCAHQTVVYAPDKYGRTVPSLELTPVCPVSGYHYGHAWLVEQAPAEVLDELRAFGDKLDGTDGLK
jgi:hypothetical protein